MVAVVILGWYCSPLAEALPTATQACHRSTCSHSAGSGDRRPWEKHLLPQAPAATNEVKSILVIGLGYIEQGVMTPV